MKGPIAIFVLALAAGAFATMCPAQQDNWQAALLLPHPDCDKFFSCDNGTPVAQACPSGLLFNVESQQCDWPDNVNCCDTNEAKLVGFVRAGAPERSETPEAPEMLERPEEPEQSVQSEQPEESAKLEESEIFEEFENFEESENVAEERKVIDFLPNGCPASRHVHWLLPSKLTCRWFFYCVNGHRELSSCAKGLHFNSELQVCDFPERSGCSNLQEA